MRKTKIIALVVLIAVPVSQGLDGDFYTNSPATGEFVSSVSSGYPYKAGEITVEAEGDLPPTNEKLVIESLGNEEAPREIRSIEKFSPGEDYQFFFGGDINKQDDLYAYTPKRPGLYNASVSVTLRGMNTSKYGPDDVTGWITNQQRDYFNTSADIRFWKDEEIVCNGPAQTAFLPSNWVEGSYFYNSTYTISTSEGNVDIYSEICGYYDSTGPPRGGSTTNQQDKDLEFRRSPRNYDPRIKTEDVGGEHYEDLFNFSWHLERRNKTFNESKIIRIRNQEIKPIPEAYSSGRRSRDDRKDDDIVESIFVKPNRAKTRRVFDFYGRGNSIRGEAIGDVIIDTFNLTYIDPIGNTVVEVNGDIFTGTSKSYSGFSDTISVSDRGKWINYSNKVELDFDGRFESLSYDDTKKIVVEGEFRADSPAGVTPEAYRIVNEDNTSQVLASFDSIDSSKEGEYIYKEVIRDGKVGASDLDSGNYTLQVKSTANNYPLEVGVRNLRIRPDQYIEVGDNETYSPQLDLGSNTVVVKTSNANSLRYNYTWNECYDPVQGVSPSNNSYVNETSPLLKASIECPSVDNVSFINAKTGSVVKNWRNVPENTVKSAETNLNIGDTYKWYVQVCDQGECHSTDIYTFTVGRSPSTGPGSGGSENVSNTTALELVIRDEDFNEYGINLPPARISPKSDGFVNKLEEESNQLEPGMDTDTLTSYRTGPINNWSNSVGSKNSADQYAITIYPNWSISNRGEPYPPWGSYYRNPSAARSGIQDGTVLKTQKVFGNSLAVVAQTQVGPASNPIAYPGQGVWIDPDDIDWTKAGGKYEYTKGPWYSLLEFKLDLTGPDSGLGYDNDGAPEAYQQGKKVVRSDIYFKRDSP